MTQNQLIRLLNYRKEYDLSRDDIHALYKVMGTAQEFIILETILNRKNV